MIEDRKEFQKELLWIAVPVTWQCLMQSSFYAAHQIMTAQYIEKKEHKETRRSFYKYGGIFNICDGFYFIKYEDAVGIGNRI